MNKSLAQAREERLDREIDKMISDRLKKANLAAPVSPAARVKLRGVMKRYAKSDTPFKTCVADNLSKLGPGRAEAVCAALKSVIKSDKGMSKSGAKMSDSDAVIDADVLLALDAISEIDLQEIFLEARALDEHGTTEAVPLLSVKGASELARWGVGHEELVRLESA